MEDAFLKYSMIRYNETLNKKVEWSVIRAGKQVANGIADSIDEARLLAEGAILEAFDAETIQHVVLCGSGESQLSLLKSTK
jgi:hypothetical protein